MGIIDVMDSILTGSCISVEKAEVFKKCEKRYGSNAILNPQ